MQIQNFFSDWLPTATGQLDSIVLSPHTLKPGNCNLTGMQADDCRLPESAPGDDFYNFICVPAENPKERGTHSLKKYCNWVRNRRQRKSAKGLHQEQICE